MGPIAVTGASGFIGRHVVDEMLRHGHRVIALVRPGRAWSIELPDVEVREWDAESEDEPPIADASALCHLAAFYPPDMRDPRHAERSVRVNAIGTLKLLQAIDGTQSHMIFLSGGQLYARHAAAADEESRAWPSGHGVFYLGSKLLAELYIEHFVTHRRTSACVLRAGSVYGPGQERGVVTAFLSAARDRAGITATQGYSVDLTYVADVAWSMRIAAERRLHGVFNIGSGVATSMTDLGSAALRLQGAPLSLLREVPGDGAGFGALNVTRARETFGFTPTPLEEGLRLTAAALPR